MRVLGLAATAALLSVFATAVLTFAPRGNDETVVPAPAATPAPAKEKASKAEPRKPKFTAGQRRARRAAVTTLRDQGYRPVTLKDYEPDHVLRVLIGKGEGGQRAFFFVGGKYLGNDAADDSADLRVARAGNRSIALSYRIFEEGDKPCCPSGGKVRVLFRWDGEQLAPQTSIPPSASRRPQGV